MKKEIVIHATTSPLYEGELPSYVKIGGRCSSAISIIEQDAWICVYGKTDLEEKKMLHCYADGELKELPVRIGLQDWEFVEDGILIHDDDKRTYKIYVQKDYIEPKDTRGGITMARKKCYRVVLERTHYEGRVVASSEEEARAIAWKDFLVNGCTDNGVDENLEWNITVEEVEK